MRKLSFYFISALICATYLLIIVTPLFAAEKRINVSAQVLVSPIWVKAISENSEVKLVTKKIYKGNSVEFETLNKGYDKVKMENQSIKAVVYLDDKEVMSTTTTSKTDTNKFVYIPTSYGRYTVIIFNTATDKEIKLKRILSFNVDR